MEVPRTLAKISKSYKSNEQIKYFLSPYTDKESFKAT